jgi:peptidoglycan hydrolase-like protein with peptidoglycan-binding domain
MSEIDYMPVTIRLREDEDVTRLQNYLIRFGYFDAEMLGTFAATECVDASPSPEVRLFDNKMRRAIAAFQSAQGLPITGELDTATRDLMRLPRCGMPDTAVFMQAGGKWNHNHLTYGFQNFTPDLSVAECRSAIRQALGLWSAVTSLGFSEAPLSSSPDIVIRFVASDHEDGSPFDGFGSTLAHAFYPPPNGGSLAGDVHFDEVETWTINPPTGNHPRDLVSVAAHEFGHALGLEHSSVQRALMYAYYSGPHRYLHADDIARIHRLYPIYERKKSRSTDESLRLSP